MLYCCIREIQSWLLRQCGNAGTLREHVLRIDSTARVFIVYRQVNGCELVRHDVTESEKMVPSAWQAKAMEGIR